jgi:hypothetical protein
LDLVLVQKIIKETQEIILRVAELSREHLCKQFLLNQVANHNLLKLYFTIYVPTIARVAEVWHKEFVRSVELRSCTMMRTTISLARPTSNSSYNNNCSSKRSNQLLPRHKMLPENITTYALPAVKAEQLQVELAQTVVDHLSIIRLTITR